MPDRPRTVGASMHARLLNLARERGQALEALLTRYALERLLHRLGVSAHRERFVLKGAQRKTPLPIGAPDGLTDEFATDEIKLRQWPAFSRELSPSAPELLRVVQEIRPALLIAAAEGNHGQSSEQSADQDRGGRARAPKRDRR